MLLLLIINYFLLEIAINYELFVTRPLFIAIQVPWNPGMGVD